MYNCSGLCRYDFFNRILYLRGVSKLCLEQLEEGSIDIDKAIEMNPEVSLWWRRRGELVFFLEQYEEAIKDFDKAIEISPEVAFNWQVRAASKHKLNCYLSFQSQLLEMYYLLN